nr:hypothetical protein BaRGS_018195 [Batillaria attramentaria]
MALCQFSGWAAEDPSMFWFGKKYTSTCEGRGEFEADCYNPRATEEDSLVTRIFRSREFVPEKVDRFLEVTYTTSTGKYRACENEFTYEFEREFTLDPMTELVMSPYELKDRPRMWWPSDKSSLFTLVFYDVGYFAIKALYVNIPESNVTAGEELMEYEGPLNPTRNHNPYIFLVFKQQGPITLTDKWRKLLTKRGWEEELEEFISAYELRGPVAMSWVLVSGDPYAAEVKRLRGYMNTCSHFVSEDPKPHRYYFLLFEQEKDLEPEKLDYSAVNCSWAFRGRCRFDVMAMVSEHNLKLVGATWMTARFDEYPIYPALPAELMMRSV